MPAPRSTPDERIVLTHHALTRHAKRLRRWAASRGLALTTSQSQESLAEVFGQKDWNTLLALVQRAGGSEVASFSDPACLSPDTSVTLHRQGQKMGVPVDQLDEGDVVRGEVTAAMIHPDFPVWDHDAQTLPSFLMMADTWGMDRLVFSKGQPVLGFANGSALTVTMSDRDLFAREISKAWAVLSPQGGSSDATRFQRNLGEQPGGTKMVVSRSPDATIFEFIVDYLAEAPPSLKQLLQDQEDALTMLEHADLVVTTMHADPNGPAAVFQKLKDRIQGHDVSHVVIEGPPEMRLSPLSPSPPDV